MKPKNQSFFSGNTRLPDGIIVVLVSFELNVGPLSPSWPCHVLSLKNVSSSTRVLRESKRVMAAGLLPATDASSAEAVMPESEG